MKRNKLSTISRKLRTLRNIVTDTECKRYEKRPLIPNYKTRGKCIEIRPCSRDKSSADSSLAESMTMNHRSISARQRFFDRGGDLTGHGEFLRLVKPRKSPWSHLSRGDGKTFAVGFIKIHSEPRSKASFTCGCFVIRDRSLLDRGERLREIVFSKGDS